MPQIKKRRAAPKTRAVHKGFSVLQKKVADLEKGFSTLRSDMTLFSSELAGLKAAVKQVDERSLRGEKLMSWIQVDQIRSSKTIDKIAAKLELELEPATPPLDAKPDGAV